MRTGKELLAEYGRAELGIDGNCGFALLGPNIQEGEVEFIEFANTAKDALVAPLDAKLVACKLALKKLKERLDLPELSYYLGKSHPYNT